MEYLWVSLGGILLVLGLLGCILPVIPGPPFSYVALLLLQITPFANFSAPYLLILAGLTLIVTLLDYLVPVWGVKRFGGSKAGVTGATVGMLAGIIFFGPFGIFFGTFVGAFVAEMIHQPNQKVAFRAAFGSLLGFMLGTGLKLMLSGYLAFVFVKELMEG